jgi:hypothetical protein
VAKAPEAGPTMHAPRIAEVAWTYGVETAAGDAVALWAAMGPAFASKPGAGSGMPEVPLPVGGSGAVELAAGIAVGAWATTVGATRVAPAVELAIGIAVGVWAILVAATGSAPPPSLGNRWRRRRAREPVSFPSTHTSNNLL